MPNHDAELVEDLLGPLPVAGAFCAGDSRPVGGRATCVHRHTALFELTRACGGRALRTGMCPGVRQAPT